ncbi:uncharacterized protein LOC122513568 isoform X3 [Polistes fuscatus]|uniref:uncharacterized protein LOC122513568 isoform X3 n=1 Tax=Polistes fuscatus TaxID=30207 RepID=UPI001CA9371C|nr:uncharacterized protein LOC122513568 isoform X3 [Polistes fuscatus]
MARMQTDTFREWIRWKYERAPATNPKPFFAMEEARDWTNVLQGTAFLCFRLKKHNDRYQKRHRITLYPFIRSPLGCDKKTLDQPITHLFLDYLFAKSRGRRRGSISSNNNSSTSTSTRAPAPAPTPARFSLTDARVLACTRGCFGLDETREEGAWDCKVTRV